MKPLVLMVGASAGSFALAAIVLDARTRFEVLCGMLGPLAAATGSWVLTDRTFRRRPAAVTAVMVTAFVFKLVFFGVYVAVAIAVLSLRPAPFAASLAAYFVGLLGIEALYLQRLFE